MINSNYQLQEFFSVYLSGSINPLRLSNTRIYGFYFPFPKIPTQKGGQRGPKSQKGKCDEEMRLECDWANRAGQGDREEEPRWIAGSRGTIFLFVSFLNYGFFFSSLLPGQFSISIQQSLLPNCLLLSHLILPLVSSQWKWRKSFSIYSSYQCLGEIRACGPESQSQQ